MQKWYDPLADIFFRPFIKSPKTAAKITLRAIENPKNCHLYKGRNSVQPLTIPDEEYNTWLWNETENRMA
jgi:hypothetical protein